MVTLDSPLNARQLEVLRWIHEGCPDGRWQGFTYKTVAIALQSRRLVAVSKRGGRWNATLEQAGLYYLEHGAFPPGHFPKQRYRSHRVDDAQPCPASHNVGQGTGAPVLSPLERDNQ